MSNPGLGHLGKLIWVTLGVNSQAQVRAAWGNKRWPYNYRVDRAESLVLPCPRASSCISRLQFHWPVRHRIEATEAVGYTLATSICRLASGNRSPGGRLITP